jgi:hypothetical protein
MTTPVKMDVMPHKAYCDLIGKGDQYVKGKIKDGKWEEGVQFFRDPDGQIWVSLSGVEAWVKSSIQRASGHTAQASKSVSAGTRSGTSQSGRASRARKTSQQPQPFVLR